MTARIIDRGRGPEIEGTRITVYRIMDFVRDSSPPEEMAEQLQLTPDQVRAALDYIANHREDVERVYEQFLERERKGNPEWVRRILATSVEELKQRYEARKRNGNAGESGVGQ